MLTSNQMAAMFQNQNAGFMNQQAYAANLSGMIGMPMPPMQTAGFNYGGLQDPYGMQSAGRFGVGGVSGVSSIAPLAMAGLGLAGGFGMLGHAGGLLDPITGVARAMSAGARGAAGGVGSAGFGGFFRGAYSAFNTGRIGAFAAGGMAAGAAAALPYYAIGHGIEHIGGSMVRGAQQDYGIHQSLMANADFYNSASRTGRGFSVAQRDMISNTVRGIADQDPFTDMGELNRILSKAVRGDVFQNTTSAQEFGQKFKQLTKTLKSMAQVMGTSMESAMEFFDASKRMGFYNKSDIMLNTQNAMVMSGGGLSARGIMQEQAAGAAVARSQGYSGAAGAILARQSVQGARDMYQSGFLSERDLGEMTGGLRGEQAYRSLGRQMQQASYSLARSGIGRAVYAALAEQSGEGDSRRFTGKLDTNLLKQFRSGMLSSGDIRRLASEKLQSAGTDTKISFLNMENDIAGNFAAGAGAQGWMGVINMVKSQRPGLSDEKVKLLMNRLTGMGRRQIEYIMKLYEKQDELNLQNANRATDLLRKRAEQADIAQNYTFQGLMRQITHSIGSVTTRPFERAGVDVARSFRNMGQGLRDWALGSRTAAGTTQYGMDTINRALGGDNSRLDSMRSTLAGMGGIGSLLGGDSDATGGVLRDLFGMGPGTELMQGLGRHIGLAQAEDGRSSIRLRRSRTGILGSLAGGAIGGLLGIPGGAFGIAAGASMGAGLGAMLSDGGVSIDQRSAVSMAGILSRADRAAQIATAKLDSDGKRIRQAMNDLTADQFANVMSKSGTSGESQHRARMSELTNILYSSSRGDVRASLERKTAAKSQEIADRMSRETGRPVSADSAEVQQLAKEAVLLEHREKGSVIDKALGDPGSINNLVGADGTFNAMKIGELQKKNSAQLASALANNGSLLGNLGQGIGAGVVAGGLLGGLPGVVAGAIGGGIGATAAWLYKGKSRVTQQEVSTLLQDAGSRQRIQRMLSGDQEALQEALQEGGAIGKLSERIRTMDPAQRAQLMKAAQQGQALEGLGSLNMNTGQLQKAGTELMGLDRGKLAGVAGDDFANALLGKSGEGGLAAELAGAKVTDLLRGGRLTQLGGRQMELAQQLAGMGDGQVNQIRGALGGTAVGRQLLAMRARLSSKFGEKLEDSGIMEAKSESKIGGILQRMGFTGLSKDDISRIKTAINTTGDRMDVQKILATKAMGVQKETPMTILTTMKGGIEKMAAVSEKLLNVMLTVEEKKGNLSRRQVKDLKYTQREAK